MDVGLDPELTKWSMHSGPVIVLTGKGYKEHHWLVVPSINLFGYLLAHHPSQCLLLLTLSLAPLTSSALVRLLFGFVAKPVTVPTMVVPSHLLCSMRRDIE